MWIFRNGTNKELEQVLVYTAGTPCTRVSAALETSGTSLSIYRNPVRARGAVPKFNLTCPENSSPY